MKTFRRCGICFFAIVSLGGAFHGVPSNEGGFVHQTAAESFSDEDAGDDTWDEVVPESAGKIAFEKHDIDGDGSLTPEEVASMVGEVGIDPSFDWRLLDVDRDQHLNLSEWMALSTKDEDVEAMLGNPNTKSHWLGFEAKDEAAEEDDGDEDEAAEEDDGDEDFDDEDDSEYEEADDALIEMEGEDEDAEVDDDERDEHEARGDQRGDADDDVDNVAGRDEDEDLVHEDEDGLRDYEAGVDSVDDWVLEDPKNVKADFENADHDRSGFLETSEIESMLARERAPVDFRWIQYDQNKDDRISLGEFFFMNGVELNGKTLDIDEGRDAEFEQRDTELAAAALEELDAAAAGFRLPSSPLSEIFRHADTDGNFLLEGDERHAFMQAHRDDQLSHVARALGDVPSDTRLSEGDFAELAGRKTVEEAKKVGESGAAVEDPEAHYGQEKAEEFGRGPEEP
eukprot:TRINITY_DN2536_c0_g1_i1.p1 TRINITY_DN2536_c0_g1~~TRINITY_DN2536_c0_g1_i1.p1  ORF type:complete len:479 (-),score=135.03 TRINITY_DN2536_c0_g1_i1:176-1537(-)